MLKPNEKILLEKLSKEKGNLDSFSINIKGYAYNNSWNFLSNAIGLPVVIFGLNDFYGNYSIAKPTPEKQNIKYLFSFFHNITNQQNVPNNLANLKTGDLVHVYFDTPFNVYYLVVQNCDKVPMYSLLNILNNRFNVKQLKITHLNNALLKKQIEQTFNVFKIEFNANYKLNSFTPVRYISKSIPDGANSASINWEFKVNENFGFYFDIVHSEVSLTFTGTW
jgi:hypothetical protein